MNAVHIPTWLRELEEEPGPWHVSFQCPDTGWSMRVEWGTDGSVEVYVAEDHGEPSADALAMRDRLEKWASRGPVTSTDLYEWLIGAGVSPHDF